ncbi:NAD(P)-binding protein [Schizophyllum commune H4-8]|uniref:NAD(P)-binding protein n=1 Tax=Schizophyllum commune (strain H4-8 / FGSC 9210) TaxID=578458 RepID=UPI0021602BC2|nr:NAD(P)-binding protein [Schizophyllum commune H4-8]KAI5888909.1 NAD(P)-binding protein [Schizophyllum commune H4-8]
MSSPRRIATVFGATGQQGGSVINALLADGVFTPRAVTRSTNSPAAKALEARGCEVVDADLGSKEAVRRAVEGAECVFGVTIPFTPISEIQQGTNMVDASKESGVKFFVWSSLPSVKEISNGKYTKVAHFDDKAEIQKYLKASGIPHANILTGFFLENFVSNMMPLKPTATGYELKTPVSPAAINTVCWIGKEMGSAVATLMRAYANNKIDELNGQEYILGSGTATFPEILGEFEDVLGKPVTLTRIPKLGVPALDEMFDFTAEYDRLAGKPRPDPRLLALGAEIGSVREFAEEVLKPFLNGKAKEAR